MLTTLRLRPRFLIMAAAAATLLAVTTGWSMASAHASEDRLAATAEYSSAVAEFAGQREAAAAEVTAAREDLRVAQATLDNSAGKVLDETARDALSAALAEAGPRVDAAAAELERADAALTKILAGQRDNAKQATASTRALSKLKMDGVSVDITAERNAVTSAVLNWQGQARATAVAAAEAAKQAKGVADRTAAAAPSAGSGSTQHGSPQAAAPQPAASPLPGATQPSRPVKAPPVPAVPKTSWDVWASGGQAEVDACKGPVDMTQAYGVPVIGEHWFCGGSAFPTADGTIITLTGLQAGQWRIGGVAATLNKQTQDTRAIPRGYELMYQTCLDGSDTTMTFTLLTRVG